jgi:serine/threonine protein kinase
MNDTAQGYPAGHRLGPYEIRQSLGSGAFADVYLARDTVLDRDVALKVIRSAEAEPGEMEGARIMCRLAHPNIVRVHAADRIGDRLVIAMDYVEGRTLREVLKESGRLDLPQALGVAHVIAEALDYVHNLRIDGASALAHLDLKPSNILVNAHGTVRIADFGLAQRFHAGSGTAVRGGGSPAYMAPEQFRSEGAPQSDLWAVGVLLYQMLTGEAPFRADSFEEYRSRICDGEPALGADFEVLPAPVREIILSCLQRDPARRPASARAVSSAIEAVRSSSGSKTCARCGARLSEESGFCPDGTYKEFSKSPPSLWQHPPRKSEPRMGGRTLWPWLSILAILLASGYSGYRIWSIWQRSRIAAKEIREITVPAPLPSVPAPAGPDAAAAAALKRSQSELAQKQDEAARMKEAWDRIAGLEKSAEGTHQDRIQALRSFLDSFPQDAEAKDAAAKLRMWEEEARAFEAAMDMEARPDAHICEKLARWNVLYANQKTGFQRGLVRERVKFWTEELDRYAGYADLTIVSASGLPPADVEILGKGQSDPYFVILDRGRISYQSRMIAENPSPIWNERVRIFLQPGNNLVLEIRDKDPAGYDLLLHYMLDRLPADGEFSVTSGSIQVQLAIRRER